MDKKDEIILQQLDVIRTMTQNNLNRMGSDFWGAPLTPDAPKSLSLANQRESQSLITPTRRPWGFTFWPILSVYLLYCVILVP